MPHFENYKDDGVEKGGDCVWTALFFLRTVLCFRGASAPVIDVQAVCRHEA